MKIFSKKNNENNQDILSVGMEIETRKVYKNITKVKGRMVPVMIGEFLCILMGISCLKTKCL